MKLVPSFVSGGLFGAGLLLSGMTRPDKVIAFLDIFGDWDPSLAAVMGGAIGVHLFAYLLVKRMPHPIMTERWSLPSRRDIDPRLVVGAVLFGVGWGLAGYCPGPALTSTAAGAGPALLFTGSMLAGMGLHRAWARLRPA